MTSPSQPIPAMRLRLRYAACIVLAALLLMWPAFLNRFPLLYPDSLTYLESGTRVAHGLFLHQHLAYYGMRSFVYALGILPWHWGVTPWPVVVFQALATAWILWLVVRTFVTRRLEVVYLAFVAVLSALTSVSWYVSLIMPDCFGPLLYLGIFLWMFARATLSKTERVALLLLMYFSAAAHTTHLMLAGILCAVLTIVVWLAKHEAATRLRAIAVVAVICLAAVLTHEALHKYLYGKASLTGVRAPFVMARLIADGPGFEYLHLHCAELHWAICDRLPDLSQDPDNFIWSPTGVWATSSPETQQRLLDEEGPFARATLRTYPLWQLRRSAYNAWQQLTSFGYDDLDPSSWVLGEFDSGMPRARSSYLQGRQVRDAMPRDVFSHVQYGTAYVSLGVVVLMLAGFRRRLSGRALWLSVVVLTVVVANPCVTATLSMADDRFQARVVWLLALLAGVLLLDWRSHQTSTE